jgi:hypothetical protein
MITPDDLGALGLPLALTLWALLAVRPIRTYLKARR